MKPPRLRSFRWRALAVVLGVVVLPAAVVAVASPLQNAALARELWLVTLGLLPVGGLVGVWLGWRMVRPLEQLRERVAERAHGKTTGVDLGLPRADEVGDLSQAFDALVATLEQRATQNQAFVTDLVHELKNPVAAIRAAAEALEGRAADAERAARIAGVLHEASARLDAVVSELLELSRAEAGMRDEGREEIDLVALVRGVTAALRDADRFPGVTFELAVAEEARVSGVPSRLDSVVRNLLENAASFAGAGGRVRASLRVDEATVTLDVEDSGPGIPDEDVPRIFERFFTTRGRQRGTGLGLSLSRAVVEAHGGSLQVLRPARGAAFRVMLPR